MFSSRCFKTFSHTFRFMIFFELNFGCGCKMSVEVLSFVFVCEHPLSSAICEKKSFPHWNTLALMLVLNELCMCRSISEFCSVLLVCIPVLSIIPVFWLLKLRLHLFWRWSWYLLRMLLAARNRKPCWKWVYFSVITGSQR